MSPFQSGNSLLFGQEVLQNSSAELSSCSLLVRNWGLGAVGMAHCKHSSCGGILTSWTVVITNSWVTAVWRNLGIENICPFEKATSGADTLGFWDRYCGHGHLESTSSVRWP